MSFRKQMQAKKAQAEAEAGAGAEARVEGYVSEAEFDGAKFPEDASETEDGSKRHRGQRMRVGRKGSKSIATHRIFVPMIAIWGAALTGLSIIVLPSSTIASIAAATQLTALGAFAKIAFALVAALFGGLIAMVIARAIARRAVDAEPGAALVHAAYREMRPIDASAELGSESLDSPLVEKPTRKTDDSKPVRSSKRMASLIPSEEPEEEEPEELVEPEDPEQTEAPLELAEELVEAPADEPEAEEAVAETAPLDLGEFAETAEPEIEEDVLELSEVAQPEPKPEPEPVAAPVAEVAPEPEPVAAAPAARPASAPDITQGSAIENLRKMPKDELSLVQMVERFAAALHEHSSVHGPQAQPRRDEALAEALRALTVLSDGPQRQPTTAPSGNPAMDRAEATERELRDALAKLQKLSGAA